MDPYLVNVTDEIFCRGGLCYQNCCELCYELVLIYPKLGFLHIVFVTILKLFIYALLPFLPPVEWTESRTHISEFIAMRFMQ